MSTGAVTVIWLTREAPLEISLQGVRSIRADAARCAAVITLALGEGPIVVVAESDASARRALELGADEVLLLDTLDPREFARSIERASLRGRARVLRDLYLLDIVRRDDSFVMELFASAIGRKLLAPLASAESATTQLLGRVGEANASEMANLVEALRAASRAVETLDRLVDSAPSDDIVDLVQVTCEVVEAVRPRLGGAADLGVDITLSTCPVPLPRWQAVQVIASVLGNAVEAVQQSIESGATRRRVDLRVSAEADAAILEVSDDGPGMPVEARERAFDAFFTTREAAGHWGLGLSITRARIERVGGGVLIDSTPGAGTTVRVFLPLAGQAKPRSGAN